MPETQSQTASSPIRGDIVAGVTTAVLLIPQSMAYAALAELPPVMGLYAAMLPLLAYALFGSARQLAVGPAALDALLIGTTLAAAIAAGAATNSVAAAIVLAALVGGIQLLMSALRMGYVANFLSGPVITGFGAAAAVIIGVSQVDELLGLPSVGGDLFERVRGTLQVLGDTHAYTAILGGVSVVALFLLKRLIPSVPRALVVCAAVIAASLLLGLSDLGVVMVGEIPRGLPTPALPAFSEVDILPLIPGAAAIALVGYVGSLSVGTVVANKHGYTLKPNRELLGLGAANIAASLSGGMGVTGGLSRTMVNDAAGATSQRAALVTALVVALALLLLGPAIEVLPRAALAALILASVASLINVAEMRRLWNIKRSDFALAVITFIVTLAFGILPGLAAGVGSSILWFVARRTKPHTAVLGRVQGTTYYRNLANFPDATTIPGVLIVRMDCSFYFGNVSFLRQTLESLEAEHPEPLRAVVIDASAWNDLDSSAERALAGIAADYRERGIRMLIAEMRAPGRRVLNASGLMKTMGRENIVFDVHQAMCAIEGAPLSWPLPSPPQQNNPQKNQTKADTHVVI